MNAKVDFEFTNKLRRLLSDDTKEKLCIKDQMLDNCYRNDCCVLYYVSKFRICMFIDASLSEELVSLMRKIVLFFLSLPNLQYDYCRFLFLHCIDH